MIGAVSCSTICFRISPTVRWMAWCRRAFKDSTGSCAMQDSTQDCRAPSSGRCGRSGSCSLGFWRHQLPDAWHHYWRSGASTSRIRVCHARLLQEIVAVVEAVGVAPSPGFIVAAKALLTATGSTQTSSMYRDLLRGVPIEADQIIGDLVERARAAGVETPLLGAIYTHLCVYQRRVLA